MTSADFPSAPSIPFPIFQVSQKVERYLLYDINTITWLRQAHNILGVLIGTLPQTPQQNVFLGLPQELQREEARLLVDQGLAFVLDDQDWHSRALAAWDSTQVEAIRADIRKQGKRVAKEFQQSKQSRTQKALKKIHDKKAPTDEESSNDGLPLETEDSTSDDALFGEPLTRETTLTPSIVPSQTDESDSNPWSITPTTSYPPLTLPSKSTPAIQPKVDRSSYALFAHLHKLGYFMSPGIRFGCRFSVYPGDPLRFHSHFLSMSYEWDEDIDLLDLIGGGRLGTGVKKGWLIGGVEQKNSDEEESQVEGKVRTFCVEWGGM